MRKFIDIISEATSTLDRHPETGFKTDQRHLRIYRQMMKLVSFQPTDENSATTLLQEIEYLKDAIKEFGTRQGPEMQEKMHLVLNHLMMFLPRDGDIEGVLADPQGVMQEISDGMKFLHAQLPREGVIVESEDFYAQRHTLKPGECFRDRDGDIVMLDDRVEGDGTKWTVALWWGSSWAYEGSTVEPSDLVARVPDPSK